MRFDNQKLKRLKDLIISLDKNQKQSIKKSNKLRDLAIEDSTPKQRDKMNIDIAYGFQYSEKLAVLIYELIIELGFQDFKGNYLNDGWCVRKK